VDVKLVSYSKASDEFKEEGLENVQDLIAFCAKVCNPTAQINMETSERLIKYLIKHQHWSPLEMVSACLEIDTTRDIGRQLLRHRSFSFQEFSQRYADPTKDMAFIRRGARLQDPKNRQNSIDAAPQVVQDLWDIKQQEVINKAREVYEWAIKEGIAKEQARSVLPEGNTMSRLYVNGTLRSWIHYIDLRSANGTQKEHMDLALGAKEIFCEQFPAVAEAMEWVS